MAMTSDLTLVLPCHLTSVKKVQVSHQQNGTGNYPLTPSPLVIVPDSMPGSSQRSVNVVVPLSALPVCLPVDLKCVNEQLVSDGEPAAGKRVVKPSKRDSLAPL